MVPGGVSGQPMSPNDTALDVIDRPPPRQCGSVDPHVKRGQRRIGSGGLRYGPSRDRSGSLTFGEGPAERGRDGDVGSAAAGRCPNASRRCASFRLWFRGRAARPVCPRAPPSPGPSGPIAATSRARPEARATNAAAPTRLRRVRWPPVADPDPHRDNHRGHTEWPSERAATTGARRCRLPTP